jgi:hypothetical protein
VSPVLPGCSGTCGGGRPRRPGAAGLRGVAAPS